MSVQVGGGEVEHLSTSQEQFHAVQDRIQVYHVLSCADVFNNADGEICHHALQGQIRPASSVMIHLVNLP